MELGMWLGEGLVCYKRATWTAPRGYFGGNTESMLAGSGLSTMGSMGIEFDSNSIDLRRRLNRSIKIHHPPTLTNLGIITILSHNLIDPTHPSSTSILNL